MNRIASTAAFALFSLTASFPGSTCTCPAPGPACAAYWSTSTLFLGHVILIDHIYDNPPEERLLDGKKVTIIGPGQYLVHIAVTQTYRGALAEQVVVHTHDQSSACGFDFKEGHDYLVYAGAAPNGDLTTSHCTGTHAVVSRDDDPDIRWIEALPKAPPGASIFGSIRSMHATADGTYDVTPLVNVTVSISGPTSKTLSSDAAGKFRADGLAPGKYNVSAAASRGYTPFPPSTVTLQDHGCAEIPWTTRLNGHISGHVYFNDGKPTAGLYLTARFADADPHKPWTWHDSYVPTAADGGFNFAPLDPGSYIIAANMSFPSQDGKPYYRKAFYPGTVLQSEAAIINLAAGQTVDDLRFYLPADSPPPTIPLHVTVLGFDGKPVPHATIFAFDNMWDGLPTPLTAEAGDDGQATITLRAGSYYNIEGFAGSSTISQSCAEPVGVNAEGQPAPLVVVLSHHFGNCMQFKKPRAPSH